jgi:hypothetical protein
MISWLNVSGIFWQHWMTVAEMCLSDGTGILTRSKILCIDTVLAKAKLSRYCFAPEGSCESGWMKEV